ncbi:hypothetical protein [uncultured Tateyamaria sp.]|uniref:hypothetical protein n=1 Tax=uncultured Tateyamaria sp. TaxID=455651 RepID=UPI0026127407|nr:hypothetical protein [uncultured Tateyamaria sp.]
MRAALAWMAIAGLAACQTGGTASDTAAVETRAAVPVSAAAGPGARSVTPAFGAEVIRTACLETRPDFRRTEQALAQLGGFVQNARTGTYFSQTHDLSVKLIENRCSVVMGGQFNGDAARRLVNATGAPEALRPGLPRPVNGKVYLSFSVVKG